MASFSDDFDDNSLDTATWDAVLRGTGAVAEQNQQIEVSSSGSSGAVIRTDSTYDITAPASIVATPTRVDYGFELGVCLTQFTGNPYDEDDWVRAVVDGGVWYLQSRVGGGSVTTHSNAAWSDTSAVHKLDFPSSGDDVRFIITSTEKASIASYPLSSRTVYLYVGGYDSAGGTQYNHFDDFEFTQAAGVSVVPILIQHYEG